MARCWAFSRARGAPSTPEAIAKSRYAYSCDRQRTMLAPSAGSLPIAALSVFEVANRDAGRQLYESHVGLTHRSRRGHALRFVALQVAEIAARLPRSPAATFGRWRQGDTALLPLEQDGERGVSAAPLPLKIFETAPTSASGGRPRPSERKTARLCSIWPSAGAHWPTRTRLWGRYPSPRPTERAVHEGRGRASRLTRECSGFSFGRSSMALTVEEADRVIQGVLSKPEN
jgi:hypothetical protein